MNVLWIYDCPNWLMGTIIVGVFVVFALGGQIAMRRILPRWYGGKDFNELVGQFLAAAGVFFRHHPRAFGRRRMGEFRGGR